MPTPEQRFEVPPEYADVYERAYRRAYEEGQGLLSGPQAEVPARRPSARRKRVAVPEQRSERRPGPQRNAQRSGQAPAAEQVGVSTTAPAIPAPEAKVPRNAGHRAIRSRGSMLYPLAGLIGLTALLMLAAFVLGRVTGDAATDADRSLRGTTSAATAPATRETPSATASPSATPTSSASPAPRVYRGKLAPLRIGRARAGCTAPAGRDAKDRPVSYAVRNVLDGKRATAWRCPGKAIGTRLVFTLPRGSRVAEVALVPGYAKTDRATGTNRYAENNRITQVAWIFGDGTRVVQTMSGSKKDRRLRTMRIVPVRTRTVTLKILAVSGGPRNTTMISTVRLGKVRPSA